MKTPITLATLSVAASLLLGACSSSVSEPQDDTIVEALNGKPSAYAEKKLGLPNKRTDTRSGAQVWEYWDNKKGMSANNCTVTLSIRNEVIENVLVEKDQQSLFSITATPCQRIRTALDSAG